MKPWIHKTNFHYLFLIILGFVLYGNTISHEYAQDDSIVITDNMFVSKGIEGIPDLFRYDTFYGFFKEEGKARLVSGGRYRPLSLVSFAIEQEIFNGNPHVSHFINILFYILIGILLYILAKSLLRKTSFQYPTLFALALSTLFLCHPVHTEVVANIKGRDELFVMFFGLLTIFFLFKKESLLNGIFACASILLGLFSKENAIVFIAIIPLLYYFLPKGILKKYHWYTYAGLVAVSAGYLLLRYQVLGPSLGQESTELMNNPFLKYNGQSMVPFNFTEKWTTITQALGKYLLLYVWPIPLTSDYYPYQIGPTTWMNWKVLISIGSYIVLIGFGLYGFLKKNIASFGILIFLGSILLTANVFFPIGTILSERFLFLPSVGLSIALVYGLLSFFSDKPQNKVYAFLPIVLFWTILTIVRNPVWKNDYTLLTNDVHTSTRSAKAFHGAAGALSEKAAKASTEEEKMKLATQSNEYIERTLDIYPLYQNAYLIRGNNYVYLQQYDEAVESYENLIELNPNHQQAHNNLRIALRQGGRYFGEKKGDLQKANEYLQRVYQLNPKDYETVRLLATSYGIMGNTQKAIEYFTIAKDIQPTNAHAWLNVGKAYAIQGDEEQSNYHLQKAVELDPKIKDEL